MMYQVSYNQTTRVALVQTDAAAVPGGSVDVGSFEHPDATYPDSKVIYHAVRDLLYKRSKANAALTAMFPYNITDMQNVIIQYQVVAPASVTVTPATQGMANNATFQLTTVVAPADTTNKDCTYTSSNELIATVDGDGTVTTYAVDGAVTITAASVANPALTDTCVITVA